MEEPDFFNSCQGLWFLNLGLFYEVLVVVYIIFQVLLNFIIHGFQLQPSPQFRQCMIPAIHRNAFRTGDGYIGLGPRLPEAGDSIGLFKGGSLPLVMRKDREAWKLIGDCYVQGI
jgi:hypothetical protein